MTLINFEPLKDLNMFSGNIRRIFDDFAGQESENNLLLNPRIDITEDKNVLTIEAEIPGVDKKDLKITVQDNILTIEGEKKKEEEKKEKFYYKSERLFGSFKRSLTLPKGVNSEKVSAKFENGILRIQLDKFQQENSKQKSIEIN